MVPSSTENMKRRPRDSSTNCCRTMQPGLGTSGNLASDPISPRARGSVLPVQVPFHTTDEELLWRQSCGTCLPVILNLQPREVLRHAPTELPRGTFVASFTKPEVPSIRLSSVMRWMKRSSRANTDEEKMLAGQSQAENREVSMQRAV